MSQTTMCRRERPWITVSNAMNIHAKFIGKHQKSIDLAHHEVAQEKFKILKEQGIRSMVKIPKGEMDMSELWSRHSLGMKRNVGIVENQCWIRSQKRNRKRN